jgi:hypothetical protein
VLYTLEYALFGLNPLGWHLTSALLYALTAFLAAWLIFRLARSPEAALIGGALFALLPAHVEAFSAVSYQTVLLMGIFALVALLVFGRILERGPRPTLLIGLALATLGSILAKEEGYALVLFFPAWAAIERPRGWPRSLGLALGATLPLALALLLVRSQVVQPMESTYFGAAPGFAVLATMLSVAALYLEILVFPLRLSPHYDWFIVEGQTGFSAGVALGAAVSLAAFAALYLAWKKKHLPAAVGLCWLILGLAPVSQIVQFMVVAADRYLYLPSLGWCAAIGALTAQALPRLASPWRRIASWALVALLAVYGARSAVRAQDWQSDQTLNTATAQSFPTTPAPLLNLANLALDQGDRGRAEELIEQALQRAPGWEPALELRSWLRRERADRGE